MGGTAPPGMTAAATRTATSIEENTAYSRVGCSVNRCGPGRTPCTMRPARMIAVVPLPELLAELHATGP